MTITNRRTLNTFYLKLLIIFSFLWLELSIITCVPNDSLKVFSFNAKPVLRDSTDSNDNMKDENFVDIVIEEEFEPLQNLSYCFRINLRDLFVQCVFSEKDIQYIFIDESTRCGFLYFHGIYYMFKFPDNIHHVAPEEWHHVCVSYQTMFQQKKKARIKMYLDGIRITEKIIDTPPKIDTRFHLGSQWTLGFCKKDQLTNHVRYTRGNITDFNVWSKALSDVEMKSFTSSWSLKERLGYDIAPPDIIDWKAMKIIKKGQKVHTFLLKNSEKCAKNIAAQDERGLNDPNCNTEQDEITLTFSQRSTFHEIALICQQLGGELFLPKGIKDIESMLSMAGWTNRTHQTCPSIWLPIFETGKVNTSYRHFKFHKQINPNELDIVEYLNWQFGQPNGQGILVILH